MGFQNLPVKCSQNSLDPSYSEYFSSTDFNQLNYENNESTLKRNGYKIIKIYEYNCLNACNWWYALGDGKNDNNVWSCVKNKIDKENNYVCDDEKTLFLSLKIWP